VIRALIALTSCVFVTLTLPALPQGRRLPQLPPMGVRTVENYVPVSQQMLTNPNPDDWLMYSRTYDAQRFSPLDQINRQNVDQLRIAWTRGMAPGTVESIPIVHMGVLYVVNSKADVQALDATNGDLIWNYERKLPENLAGDPAGFNSLAIFEDLVFYCAPDGYLVALDAASGKLRWEAKAGSVQHSSGPLVVDGKVITGHAGEESRADCYVVAHDARTGKELWKFYATAGPGEPGGNSWGDMPLEKRMSSLWGLPGTYDPERGLLYWGIANPIPRTRIERHGAADAIPTSAPAELYSDSTIALDARTGKLAWYYQHVPGDDWGKDVSFERTLLRTAVNPDRRFVRWINPKVSKGEERDVLFVMGEPGGMWALDRTSGQFLWGTPFPERLPEFYLSKIDAQTGATYINEYRLFKEPGERNIICFFNARSPWPPAFNPTTNALYVPYIDSCLDITQGGNQLSVPLPGSEQAGANRSIRELAVLENPISFTAMAKVNAATGEVSRFDTGPAPGNGAMLATAGNLVFWGDLNRRFKAFDGDSGKILWESILGGTVSVSTVTYAVNGKQYIAVMTGNSRGTEMLLQKTPQFKPPRDNNAIYVFALPDSH